MRTRATGQSPSGFQVLEAPKRTRRQPKPKAVAFTIALEKVPITPEELDIKVPEAASSPSPPLSESRSVSPATAESRSSTSPAPSTRTEAGQDRNGMNLTSQKQSAKKTLSSRKLQAHVTKFDDEADKQLVKRNRSPPSLLSTPSNLGKRGRSTYETSLKRGSESIRKRLRQYGAFGQENLESITNSGISLHSHMNSKEILSFHRSLNDHDEAKCSPDNGQISTRDESSSSESESESQQTPVNSSSLGDLSKTQKPAEKQIYNRPNIDAFVQSSISTIKSRMNPFTYDPLAQEAYQLKYPGADPNITENWEMSDWARKNAEKKVSDVANNNTNAKKASDYRKPRVARSPILAAGEAVHYTEDIHKYKSGNNSSKGLKDGIAQEQIRNEEHITKNLQDRHVEAEKLFQTAVPDAAHPRMDTSARLRQDLSSDTNFCIRSCAAYSPSSSSPLAEASVPSPLAEVSVIPHSASRPHVLFFDSATIENFIVTNPTIIDIVRAVAEWAASNSSALPSKQKIIQLLDASKLPEATSTIATAKNCDVPQASVPPARHATVTWTSPVHTTINMSPLSDSSYYVEDHVMPTPPHHQAPSSSPAAIPLVVPASSGWSAIMSKVKDVIVSPIKLFERTPVDTQKMIEDIDLSFKPATPNPSIRRLERVNQDLDRRAGLKMPVKRLEERPETEHLQRHRTPANKLFEIRQVISKKRKLELQQQQNVQRSRGREVDEDYDAPRRRKTPVKIPSVKIPAVIGVETEGGDFIPRRIRQTPFSKRVINSQKQVAAKYGEAVDQVRASPSKLARDRKAKSITVAGNISPKLSVTSTEAPKQIAGEWPPNLDPNRRPADVFKRNTLRGPNGEHPFTMATKGWIVSPWFDSFIPNPDWVDGKPPLTANKISSIREEPEGPIGQPLTRCLEASPSGTYSVPDEEPPTSRVQEISDRRTPELNFAGTFTVPDESSSDEDDDDDEIAGDAERQCVSSDKTEFNVMIPSEVEIHSSIPASSSKEQPLFPPLQYTPRRPSALRNVENISPYSWNPSTHLPKASSGDIVDWSYCMKPRPDLIPQHIIDAVMAAPRPKDIILPKLVDYNVKNLAN